MAKNNLKFVIVGHPDHGKSTLIGRLLFDTDSLPSDKIEEIKKVSKNLGRETEFAFLLDHLQEEREQGLTIDTSQTFFEIPKRGYLIIDTPGHIQFVKNMITGASQAEAAILIIDVKEGIKEQTKRHAYILSLLGLNQIIVVLNKMDLVGYQREIFEKIKETAKEFLNLIEVSAGYYIPISALKGDNIAKKSEKMDWYQGPTVSESLDSLREKLGSAEQHLIFPVQDVYQINQKRMIVGRVEAGELNNGQEIKVLPEGKITKVKSIEKFNENLKKVLAGENIGLTIEDSSFIERGSVICQLSKEPDLTNQFAANLFWMTNEELKKGEMISLKCASQEIPARIKEIKKRIDSSTLGILEQDAQKLENLEVGEVIIETKRPIVTTKFREVPELGRFVLIKNKNISAGGTIV